MKTQTEGTTPKTYIIRTAQAGVFFAELGERRGSEADLINARRIHYWQGATDGIGISQTGVGALSRITTAIPAMTVLGVIEILPCSDAAHKNLSEFPVWAV